MKKVIFVFGSNLAGRHGKGAALFARKYHGAVYGQGEGLQGESYGIPTKDEKIRTRSLEDISLSVQKFLQFAKDNPQLIFSITPIGCGLAGYKQEQIKPLFKDIPDNCLFSREWVI